MQVWDEEQGKHVLVEIPLDHVGRRRSMSLTDRLVSESHYDGVRALDGTPIDSRQKHKLYMKQRGLAHFGDYSEDWYAKRRAEIKREEQRDRNRDVRDIVTRHER